MSAGLLVCCQVGSAFIAFILYRVAPSLASGGAGHGCSASAEIVSSPVATGRYGSGKHVIMKCFLINLRA